MDAQDRLKKRLALSTARNALKEKQVSSIPDSSFFPYLPSFPLPMNLDNGLSSSRPTSSEVDILLSDVREGLNEAKFIDLLEACQRECLQAAIRPFGLARVLFEDKEGGNVDTVHNARTQSKDKNGNLRFRSEKGDEFYKDKDGKNYYVKGELVPREDAKRASPINVYATEEERLRFDKRERYDGKFVDKDGKEKNVKDRYHKHKNYTQKNKNDGKLHEEAALNNVYTNEKMKCNEKRNLDHVVAAKNVHDDNGRVLAEMDGADLACHETNLASTSERLNKSKKAKTAREFIEYVGTRIAKIDLDIERTRLKDSDSEAGQAKIEELKAQRDELKRFDEDKLLEAERIAREEMDKKINRTYYRSDKFRLMVGFGVMAGS